MLRELKQTKIEGRIYLFPIPVIKDRKYLIACESEAQAEQISQAVRSQQITHPDLISPYFIFLTYHTDKRTKIFVLAPNNEGS
jgi:hypothetical protein